MKASLLAGTVALALSLLACASERDESATPVGEVEPPFEIVEDRAAAETLIDEALSDPDPWVRAETVRLVAITRNPAFIGRLRERLDDEAAVVRSSAIYGLVLLGDDDAQQAALSSLAAGTSEEKLDILRTLLESAPLEFRAEAAGRSLRDRDPEVRLEAVLAMTRWGVVANDTQLDRMLSDEDPRIRELGFQHMLEHRRDAALDRVLDNLRGSSAADERAALLEARYLAMPSLWPTLRSYATSPDPELAFLANVALGALNDPTAEEPLRNVILTDEEGENAAVALRSISQIPTERASTQPLRQRNDQRLPVRVAALEIMIAGEFDVEDFNEFLDDEDPSIAQRALLHMQTIDSGLAATNFRDALAESEDPLPILRGLYHTSLATSVEGLIGEISDELRRFSVSDDPALADIAIRLRLVASEPITLIQEEGTSLPEQATFAIIEDTLADPRPEHRSLYTQGAQSSLFLIRVAAAVGLWSLEG